MNAHAARASKKLNFFVIGAQKSGTTSLYHYLSRHPSICMHSSKELAVVIDEVEPVDRYREIVAQFYRSADLSKSWGAVAPHCMCDHRSPERLKRLMPDGKYIAILRDPIERALSHYTMLCQDGRETRSFDDAIRHQLDPENLARSRNSSYEVEKELDRYVAWSEYGRILDRFVEVLGGERLLIVFLEDMAARPTEVFRTICGFIGVGDDVVPSNVGVRYFGSSDEASLFTTTYRLFRNNSVARALWRLIVPRRIRSELIWRHNLRSIAFQRERQIPSPLIEVLLTDHLREDVRALEQLAGRKAPWERFDQKA